MGRYVTIFRWTPEQALEVARRASALTDGTAPPSVLAAYSKLKIVTTVNSPNNQIAISIYDVDETDYVEATLTAVYFSDTVKLETYPVLSQEDGLKLNEFTAKMAAGQ